DLGRWINDSANHAINRNRGGNRASRIDAGKLATLVRTSVLEKIPPRNSVLRRQHHRVGAEERREIGNDGFDLMRLDPEDDQVLCTKIGYSIRSLYTSSCFIAALIMQL